MISLRRKKLRFSDKLIDTVTEWRKPLVWLFLFIIVVAVGYGHKASAVILFTFFRSLLIVYLLIFLPFLTGLAGFTKSMRSPWLIALGAALLLAGIYHLIHHESIWRIWYQGEFDKEYVKGLVKAATIVPGISFLIGFVSRYWLE